MTASADTVSVTGGLVRGTTSDDGVRAFLGIPFAAPPVGADRFQPPRPVVPWPGVRPADRFGPTVPKARLSPHFEQMWPERWIPGDESLNLNVWAPAAADIPAPVLVWIHGGGFTNGSGSARELDGHAFAADGVVCVTINYRVGPDGFLALDDGIANVGLLDQVAALEWVRDNVAAFGGDPGRVTLAGHSAGGSSVACLLTSPRTDGLYARAIIQSTSGIARLTGPAFAQRVAVDLAQRLGIAPRRSEFARVPTSDLLHAVGRQQGELAGWGGEAATMAPWAPQPDGDVLPIDPIGEIRAGRAATVPLLTGTTRDELRLHLTPEYLATIGTEELVAEAAAFGLTSREVAIYRDRRPAATAGDVLAAIETDWYFRRPIVTFAEARVEGGAADTWLYRFDHPEPDENAGYGAAHGVEVPYVFATTHIGETHARIGAHPSAAVERFIHRTWVDFVRGAAPAWPRYDLGNRMTALLTDVAEAASDPDGEERVAWSVFR
ncbi:carboxylesterase/lipase family protein [Microbacterium sp. RD1]|uniref:carboxylesterase/lipase family protein n=1 Tax=Microbacterium sp. RD1 TaxID=3457313 RepID=UPI003FA53106